MKQLVLLVMAALAFACNSNPNNPKEPPADPNAAQKEKDDFINDSTNWTTTKWTDSIQNFGKVTDGEKVLISFHVKNIGTKPLVISSVTAGCGCTVPSKPEEPILPGAEGIIKAEFNSSGRVGKADKYVTVRANTREREHVLKFEGEVLAKQETTNTNNK